MSVGVTEPKSEPVGPAFTSKRSSVFSSVSAICCACSTVFASCRARCCSRFCSSATFAGVAGSASLARQEEVARVAARDVHDLAAEADVLDVVEEDDFHSS